MELQIPSKEELVRLRDSILRRVNERIKERHDGGSKRKRTMQEVMDSRLYK